MAMVKCRTRGCDYMVREGLKRPSYTKGSDGQQLADGEFCWRCRRRQAQGRQGAVDPRDEEQRGG